MAYLDVVSSLIIGILIGLIVFYIRKSYKGKGAIEKLRRGEKEMSRRINNLDDELGELDDEYVDSKVCNVRYTAIQKKLDHLTNLVENMYENNGHGDPKDVEGKPSKSYKDV